MENLYILIGAIEYIEKNICEPFIHEQLAETCHTSPSNLHRLFRYTFNYSLREYIVKRRIGSACRDLAESNMNICDIAFKYQYNSHEVFTRAFIKQCGITPSEFRKNPEAAFPDGGDSGKKNDMSYLYKLLESLRGSYIVCAKIFGLPKVINKYGRDAGEFLLSAASERLTNNGDMTALRIGRDIFVIITASNQLSAAEDIVSRLESQNGTAVKYKGNDITLLFDIGIMRLPESGVSFTDLSGRFSPVLYRGRESKKLL